MRIATVLRRISSKQRFVDYDLSLAKEINIIKLIKTRKLLYTVHYHINTVQYTILYKIKIVNHHRG